MMIFPDYPGHFTVGALFVIFGVLIAFAFRSRELQKEKLKQYKWLLALLQYASIVILLVILWNPSRHKPREIVARNSVMVLFDTSESMSVVEDRQLSRLDKALGMYEKKFRPLDPKGPAYKVYGFDQKTYHSGSSDLLRRWGSQTNIHSVLALLSKYDTSEQLSSAKEAPKENDNGEEKLINKARAEGAVIFTDGQADNKTISTYLPLRNKNFPIVFVCVGSKQPRADIAIKSINAPARVAVDTAYNVEVVVAARNLQNQAVTIELLKDGNQIDSRRIPADKFRKARDQRSGLSLSERLVTAEFAVGADRLGRHRLSARAKHLEQETNSANNARSTMVDVVERNTLKVLFYSQIANFNIGKVRQALARDKNIQLDLGLDVIKEAILSEKARTMCGHVKLPAERNEFYKYDVIILGSCALDRLSDARIEGLYSFVVDRGGGLILLPGRDEYGPAEWKNERIKVLAPVFFDAYTAAKQTTAQSKIELTIEGIDSKVIGPKSLQDHDGPALAYYHTIDKKPAATTLARISDNPLVTVHRVGRGRVCLLNVSKLFRWYREDLQGGLLQKVMSGLTAYMGSTTNLESTVELFVERANSQTNKVRFSAYVCDKSFTPVSGTNVLLNVGDNFLSMNDIGGGYYVAEIDDYEGEAIVATVQAELNGLFLGERSVTVNLPVVRTEMDNVESDPMFLQALAKRVGAKYFDIDNLDESAAKMFEGTTKVGSSTFLTSVWPRWSLLLVLCLILGVNWFVRRAVGLV
ncbi:MAG: hypothetical protein ACYSWZ_21940 [Planctomycetota bacterium]|jgi:hypothetical protein